MNTWKPFFIWNGKYSLADGTAATYQTLPWDMRGIKRIKRLRRLQDCG